MTDQRTSRQELPGQPHLITARGRPREIVAPNRNESAAWHVRCDSDSTVVSVDRKPSGKNPLTNETRFSDERDLPHTTDRQPVEGRRVSVSLARLPLATVGQARRLPYRSSTDGSHEAASYGSHQPLRADGKERIMNVKPLITLLSGVSSLLLLAGSTHAQGFWGAPGGGRCNSQPRYVSPCGPAGCSIRSGGGVAQTGCANGVCNQPRNGYSTNYGSRGAACLSCGQYSGGSRACANGTCVPQPRYYSNPPIGNAPWDNGYSGYAAPNRVPQGYVAPQGYMAPQGYGSYRPSYQYDRPDYRYEAAPYRAAPQPARGPRYYGDDEYSASNPRGFETTSIDRSRGSLANGRSPFYP